MLPNSAKTGCAQTTSRHQTGSGAKTLEKELGVEDLNHDEAAVKRAIYRLFLEYPSDDIILQMNYRNKAREFYDDVVIDVYSGSRELSKYLTNDVAAKFAKLREDMANGKDGAQKAEI